jgi:hypothetical protein
MVVTIRTRPHRRQVRASGSGGLVAASSKRRGAALPLLPSDAAAQLPEEYLIALLRTLGRHTAPAGLRQRLLAIPEGGDQKAAPAPPASS